MKKKLLITLSVVACALLLVVGSIAGTIAYLTSTATVTNTFTVGNIVITLDEGKVGEDGKFIDADKDGVADSRVSGGTVDEPANKYHLLPGKTYFKDPIVHVEEGSESCWVFVKVDNGLAGAEADGDTIESQILANNWTKLEDGVYYKKDVNASAGQVNLPVFQNIKIKTNISNTDLAAFNDKAVTVTAYAIQSAELNDAAAAWTAVSTAANNG